MILQPECKTRGFSLPELILSIALIGTSLLLVVGLFTYLVRGSQKAADLTAGSVMADSLLQQHIYQVMAVDTVRTAFFVESYATPTLYRSGSCTLNSTVFFYNLYCNDVPLNTRLQCADTDGTRWRTPLKRFDIVVWWNDSANPDSLAPRMGRQADAQGMQEVHQVRVLWPNGGY